MTLRPARTRVRDDGPPARGGWRAAVGVLLVAALGVLLAGCTSGSGHHRAGSAPAGHRTAAVAAVGARHSAVAAVVRAGVAGVVENPRGFFTVPATDRAQQADLLRTNCENPDPNVMCVFAPSEPLKSVLGAYKLVAKPYPVCEPQGYESVSASDTSELSDSLGVSVSVEIGAMVKQAWEASYSVTWTSSHTTKVDDEMELPPFSWGYVYRAAPMLRSTGNLIIRRVGPNPGRGGHDIAWPTYLLVGVSFDVPDTGPTAHGNVELATRAMTAAEKAAQCPPNARAHKQGTPR